MNDRVNLPQARDVCPTTTRRLIEVRERSEVAQMAFDVPDIVVMPLSEFEQCFAELPRDLESKRSFMLLLPMASLVESGTVPQAPLLSIPAR